MAQSNSPAFQGVDDLLRSLTAYLPHSQQPAPVASPHEALSQSHSLHHPIDPQGHQSQWQAQPPYSGAQQSQTIENNGFPEHHFNWQQAPLSQSREDQKRLNPSTARSTTPPAQSIVDPRSIIEWPAALRYVTKLTAQHDGVVEQLRRMISNQHENERNWWAGREALQKQQADRVDGKKALDDVFRSLGVQAAKDVAKDDNAEELKRYDLKVHKAQSKMFQAMENELKGFGIPFYGTREALIIADADEARMVSRSGVFQSKQISKLELSKLQKRMLAFLEELCGD